MNLVSGRWQSSLFQLYFIIIIIRMEICKAPTLRLIALNKHSITHIMYIEMEMLSAVKMYIDNRPPPKKNPPKPHIM